MTDNGPQQIRYNSGMRGRKSMVYQGGVRVPFYLQLPQLKASNNEIDIAAAHIDILPTIAQICNVEIPEDRPIDGKSLLPLLKSENASWPDRSLFFYWTRRYPELYNNIALQKGSYKLVGMTDHDADIRKFELFNISKDPFEQNNIVDKNRDVAVELKVELDKIYDELIHSENLQNPPRTIVGSSFENPVFLNRNDASGERGIWSQEEIFGKWDVHFEQGRYNFRFKFIKPIEAGGRMILEANQIVHQQRNDAPETDIIEMKNISLSEMDCDLIPIYIVKRKRIFPFWVEVEKVD